MRYEKIFIDMSNLYHRAFAVSDDEVESSVDDKKIMNKPIILALKMINSIEEKFLKPDGEIYFLFDNAFSGVNRRLSIDPGYKANRKKKDEKYFRSLDIFHELLLDYKDSYFCVQVQGYEADDLVKPLINQFDADTTILLVTNDSDWFRSISKNVHLAKYESKIYKVFTPVEFYEKYGFEAKESSIILYKSLNGDSTDNIPKAVDMLKETDLQRICTDYNSVDDLMNRLNSNMYLTTTFKERIKNNYGRIKLNESLVSTLPCSKEDLIDGIHRCKFNAKTLSIRYNSINLDYKLIDRRVADQELKKRMESESTSSFFTYDSVKRR